MRHINKRPAPNDLKAFVEGENPHDWPDIHKSKGYPQLYEDCLRQLLDEQGEMSGYTEKPLVQGNGAHVDHFRKRSMFRSREDIFGWNNLIADEHNRNYGADYKDKTVTKIEEYRKLINPVAQDPHHFFTYMENGLIIPRKGLEDEELEMAEFTIQAFNLDHEALRKKRENAIRLVRIYRRNKLDEETIRECMKCYGFISAIDFALE